MPGQGGSVAINPLCPAVKQHLCMATSRAITLRLKAGRQDLGDQLKEMGMRNFGCEDKSLGPSPEAR